MHCPSEESPWMQFNTAQNPWPPKSGGNTRSSYNMYPSKFMGGGFKIKNLPSLDNEMAGMPLYTDSFVKKSSLNSRHTDGINALYTDGHVKWQIEGGLSLSLLTGYGSGFTTSYQKVWDELEENP